MLFRSEYFPRRLFRFTYLLKTVFYKFAHNLIKFNGIQLPGGVAINGRDIFEDAEKEIAEIEESSSSTYELPPFDMIG